MIDESALRWFGRTNRMGNYRMTKRAYAGSRLVSWPRKRWIDSLNDCLKKKLWILGKQELCIVEVYGGVMFGGMLGE